MPRAYRKVYTCTPVAFHANDWFFIRDSGLIARTLRSLGMESKAIMPLPYYEDDLQDEIIRTSYKNLESTEWWQALQLDALVLYSWGAPRYRKIAKAIHQAGIRLIIHMDSSGDFVGDFPPGTSCFRRWWTLGKIKLQDILRARHLSYADIITMCPRAAQVLSNTLFYSKDIVSKCYPMPCPVSPECTYTGVEKRDIILCIGRWDDTYQKRPDVLMHTIEAFYAQPSQAEIHIYGSITSSLQSWWNTLPPHIALRVKLIGNIPNAQLRLVYNQAKIILCTSRYESSHIVSAEALCCGCSVVTPNRPAPLRDVLWYTTKNSGTISQEDTPESLAQALRTELTLWHRGARNPHDIATAWQPFFHADKVFNSILS